MPSFLLIPHIAHRDSWISGSMDGFVHASPKNQWPLSFSIMCFASASLVYNCQLKINLFRWKSISLHLMPPNQYPMKPTASWRSWHIGNVSPLASEKSNTEGVQRYGFTEVLLLLVFFFLFFFLRTANLQETTYTNTKEHLWFEILDFISKPASFIIA